MTESAAPTLVGKAMSTEKVERGRSHWSSQGRTDGTPSVSVKLGGRPDGTASAAAKNFGRGDGSASQTMGKADGTASAAMKKGIASMASRHFGRAGSVATLNPGASMTPGSARVRGLGSAGPSSARGEHKSNKFAEPGVGSKGLDSLPGKSADNAATPASRKSSMPDRRGSKIVLERGNSFEPEKRKGSKGSKRSTDKQSVFKEPPKAASPIEPSFGRASKSSLGAAVEGRGGGARRGSVTVKDIMDASLREQRGRGGRAGGEPNGQLRRIAFSSAEEVVIFRGHFSWLSAIMMCFFVLAGFAALVFMVLTTRDTSMPLIAEETSYIDAANPPWQVPPHGYVPQPGDAEQRRIGQRFRFAMPQFTLFYAVFSSSFSLFTVAYFSSELLVQDLGVLRVKNMGEVINRGVSAFLYYTFPVIVVIMCAGACAVYFLSGMKYALTMLAGAAGCMGVSHLGWNMNFQGGPRLAHALNYDIVASIQMGVRTGAIGGLSAHALAQLGVVLVWLIAGDADLLVGFGIGASIVAFYTRIGGGIFGKGCDIGADYVTANIDDYHAEHPDDSLRAAKLEEQGDGAELDKDVVGFKQKVLDPNAIVNEDVIGYITSEEAQLRTSIEKQMEKMLESMHPVNYLDNIGENIMDVGGTCSDLFETLCIVLATAVILGAKAHDVPFFGTSLPFTIISTGTLGCSAVSYYVWLHSSHETWRIRRHMQLNLFVVMLFVQAVASLLCYLQWRVYRTISLERMANYLGIVALGLISPELCVAVCEFFTSVNCRPVARLVRDADLGMIQVVLQGLGQGFLSAGLPSIVNIVVQIFAFRWEGFYGLVLLASASLACTGWQASLSAYGAVANNASRIVHLTTVNEIALHRANVCAIIGTQTAHNGKCVASQNAFFTTAALLGALLADKYTKLGKDFQSSKVQELSEFARAGTLAGILFAMLFLAHTLTSSIAMAKQLVVFCKNNPGVLPRVEKTFPATHIKPVKRLVAHTAIESFKLTFAPMCQTFGAPLVIGQLLGFKGLMMLVNGSNSVSFSLSMFLINTGQAWDAARKYVLFGMLKDSRGEAAVPESEVYDTLGLGEQIGGPLEDLAGPALNNFNKFVAVVSFVTDNLYDEYPDQTWPFGIAQVFINFTLVAFFRFGLSWTSARIESFFKRRREAIEEEEGVHMLREIEERERRIEERLSKSEEERGLGLY